VLDHAKVVNLHNGEQYRFKITAGQHIAGSLCTPLIGPQRSEALFNAEAGMTYIFRIYNTFDDICLLAPMSNSEGEGG
jgi:hypothetical protein